MKKTIFLLFAVAFLGGCATIMLGEYQTITVTSDIPDTKITIRGQVKTAPAKFEVKRGLTGLQVYAEKEGYMPLRKPLKSEISGLAYTDTLLATNPQSYAKPRYYNFKPSKVHFKMISSEKAGWKDVKVVINDLKVQPTIVRPGSEFGYVVRFSIFDNTNLDPNVSVSIEYSILQNNTVLFSDTVTEKTSKKNQYMTSKTDLVAGQKTGLYQLAIKIRYRELSAEKVVPFEVR